MVLRFRAGTALLAYIESYLQDHNLANRGIEDGDYAKQRIGLIGEFVVHHYLLGKFPNVSTRKPGFDGGFDISYRGYSIDVKTMGRNSYVRPDFVNNFYLLQAQHDSDIIVFCSYHIKDNVVEICGWLPKNELATRGIYYAAGTKRVRADRTSFTFRQNNYEVENKHLDDIELLKNITAKTTTNAG